MVTHQEERVPQLGVRSDEEQARILHLLNIHLYHDQRDAKPSRAPCSATSISTSPIKTSMMTSSPSQTSSKRHLLGFSAIYFAVDWIKSHKFAIIFGFLIVNNPSTTRNASIIRPCVDTFAPFVREGVGAVVAKDATYQIESLKKKKKEEGKKQGHCKLNTRTKERCRDTAKGAWKVGALQSKKGAWKVGALQSKKGAWKVGTLQSKKKGAQNSNRL